MDWSRDRELSIRMVVTLGLLALVTLILVGGLWGVVVVITSGFISFVAGVFLPAVSGVIGVVVTGLIVWAFISIEYSGETPALRGFSTQPMENTPYSKQLSRTVERLANQAGLPVPTVVVADTTLPNSYTSGLSPQQATIVVTTGLLEKLEAEEVEAVLAHELAHVKHRDAAVMTIASVPLVMARRLHEWVDKQQARPRKEGGPSGYDVSDILFAVCNAVADTLWLSSRLLFRLLSRYRELAADRGAIALTGSPAALASGLETVDTQLEALPRKDLRSADESIEAFAIVPVERKTVGEPIRLGPNGERRPYLDQYIHPIRKRLAPLLATHPSLERRRQQLQTVETEL